MLRIIPPLEGIDHRPWHRRIVDHPGGKHAAQNAVIHVLDPRQRYLPLLHRLFQRRPKVNVLGHLLIEPGQRGLHGAVRPAPVREHPSLEAEVLLQNLVQQPVVSQEKSLFTRLYAHHSRGLGNPDRNLKRQQIALPRGLVVDVGVDNIAARSDR